MGVLDRLFGYRQKHNKSQNNQRSTPAQSRDINARKLIECGSFIDSWILLYEITRITNDRTSFYEKLSINKSKDFYDSLFDKEYSFYDKKVIIE